jgi:hypothetical protein
MAVTVVELARIEGPEIPVRQNLGKTDDSVQ